ncbi:polyribonucleotide nucleotidyltransferase [Candidatus Kuenenbacteria bacterium RIFCSPHIGHO2_02_FULL_39_13]|uniref:Polyribonucleotide nucleotidyltransferase n=1 Tax=Candidatus Kuenenbacteria bacterium RIFCSPHIGHO2_02_FULL_39_13 TaxID=1798561 RepID=A0A1F6FLN5_9BACT|nr:MAG: polyribonucleotide nucleotidyltransferase [Candidatus Kuenenbacteria bacterium RIFCSPHIGHO2_02_FULL_39_13]
MEKNIREFSTQIGGKTLTITSGKFAAQTNGACTVQYGGTVVLATVVLSQNIREGLDYFPLMVDFDEKLYAAGKIKGSRFIKREGRASDEAIISGRIIDRSIRPLFPQTIKNDVQIIVTVLSFDNENDADVLGLIAASCALSISNIPWLGPIAATRVGRINNELVLNPSYEARQKSDLDLFVAANMEKVVMIEAGANEVKEDDILAAIQFAQKHINKIIKLIEEITGQVGQKKIDIQQELSTEELASQKKIHGKVNAFMTAKRINSIFNYQTKEELKNNIDSAKKELDVLLKADNEISKDEREIGVTLVDEYIDKKMHALILEQEKRPDGRKLNEIRPLSAAVGVLPRTHGSGLFERGETQVLSVVTLGAPGDEQTVDTMEESGKKRYMHHYNFPPFSVGEVAPLRGPSRRDIGHGALAEKALLPMIPDKETFPYTIRVVSEVLSSNGSSSQASVCGSTLSLMDAGVPLKKPVAGIAMGIISDPTDEKKYKILTDIQGLEDHSGDMDFKIAGTRDGITAIQMDTKINGLTNDMIKDTFVQAKRARLEILEVMAKAIAEPRQELSPYAPRITTLHINPEKIRDVIGPGGKMINKIIDETGVSIDIEDDGSVFITSTSAEGAVKAKEWVELICAEAEVGKIYKGKVTRLMDFGAFVEILPGQEGLIHISEMAPFRVNQVSDVVSIGDEIEAKVKEIDDQNRINLTLSGTNFDFSKIKRSDAPVRPRNDRNFTPRRGSGNRNNNRPRY